MPFITNTESSFFESLGWSELIKLYPSSEILSALLSMEKFRNVSDRHMMP